jgi:hypothetical protein
MDCLSSCGLLCTRSRADGGGGQGKDDDGRDGEASRAVSAEKGAQ